MEKSKRTKIIATLGPSCSDEMMEKMVDEGINLVRVNFSHGSHSDHEEKISTIRKISAEKGCYIGIIADLQGPKIRIGQFAQGKVHLKTNDRFTIDLNRESPGDHTWVSCSYKTLAQDIHIGSILLIDDGKFRFEVETIDNGKIHCRACTDSTLSDNKGLNVLGGGLSAPALTEDDMEDLKFALAQKCDYIALSFVKHAQDVTDVRQIISQQAHPAGIIAKIERPDAVTHIESILQAADAIMVARGDLGVEVNHAQVPVIQKLLLKQARVHQKPVIIATQMMESMITSTVPTRAEVSDVANAILDGCDAVMLSAETAVGHAPDRVINAVTRTCLEVENYHVHLKQTGSIPKKNFEKVSHGIAAAAMFLANQMNISAIIALTESGATPRLMSRVHSGIPIFALSPHDLTCGKVSLFRDVFPIQFNPNDYARPGIYRAAADKLLQQGLITKGQQVIITYGDFMGIEGSSNALKVVTA